MTGEVNDKTKQDSSLEPQLCYFRSTGPSLSDWS